jgi:hypothetical protein
VIRLLTHFFEPQFPTREQRPKLTEGGGAWRQLAQAIAKQEREEHELEIPQGRGIQGRAVVAGNRRHANSTVQRRRVCGGRRRNIADRLVGLWL